jgi:dolichol-phosphate mannosyltransferase
VRPDVLVVLPTYNEIENIDEIVGAILAHGVQLLVVDDGSPDGTGQRADQLAAEHAQLSVLHRPSKQGLGPAYVAGFQVGLEQGAAILCEIDADFSHDPADLPRLIAAVDDGADLAIGSRYVEGGGVDNWPWHRRLLSRGGNVYAALMLGASVRDMTAGYRAFRADSLRRLQPETCQASGYGFQVEMAWRASKSGMTVAEVPIIFRDRVRGMSKMNSRIAFEAIWLVTRWGFARLVTGLRPTGRESQ